MGQQRLKQSKTSYKAAERDRHGFEHLRKIIGVAIKIDFSCFRTFVICGFSP